MALAARDLKNDDTTDAGFDLILDGITSPVTGDVGVTRIDVGTGTTVVRMDSSNPLFAQLTAGTAEVGKLAAGTAEIGNVKNSGTFAVQIVDTSFAVADGNALGEGVLIQGDDGTDRKNVNVDATTGDIQVDITHTVTVDGSAVTQPVSNAGLTELAAAINSSKLDIDIASSTVDVMLGSDFSNVLGTTSLVRSSQADNISNSSESLQTNTFLYGFDGTVWDRMRGDATNGLLVNLGTNNDVAATLQAGTAEFGKLAAGVAEIGNVKNSGTFAVQIVDPSFAVADGNALGEGVLVQGDDGTDRKNINVDATTGDVQVDVTNTVTVDGSGVTQPVSGTVTANLSAIDNAVLDTINTAVEIIDNVVITHDAGAGTAVGNMMMGQRDDEVGGTETTNADGDAQALTTNKFGQLKTTGIADATSEVKYSIIDAASSGNNTIQASAGAGKKIRVLSAFLVSAGTVNARFESGANGTALTGQMNLVANSGFTLPFNPGGWFETADDTLLNLELSGAISVDGCLSYVEV